jgi:hypothetical protein
MQLNIKPLVSRQNSRKCALALRLLSFYLLRYERSPNVQHGSVSGKIGLPKPDDFRVFHRRSFIVGYLQCTIYHNIKYGAVCQPP